MKFLFMVAKRIIGFVILAVVIYLGYVKLGENMRYTEYSGFVLFFFIALAFAVFLLIRKILIH